MKKICFELLFRLFVLMMIFVSSSCNSFLQENDRDESAENTLSVLSWNVQALFDGEDHRNEYDEYRASTGWTKEKYKARLHAIEKGITEIPEKPDMLVLIEIENAEILEDLASSSLAEEGYQWTFFARNPGASLGIGIISKRSFTFAKSHSIILDGTINPRPMAEVQIDVEGEPFVLFACHWKSKLGDPEITEMQRRSSAQLALRRIAELERENPKIPIIVMGDLNENHDEFFRSGGKTITALLPDDEKAANLVDAMYSETGNAHQNFFIVGKEKNQEAVYFDFPYNFFYTPWEHELQDGSYVYRENWETIDHFLLRPNVYDGFGWDFSSCRIVAEKPFATEEGNPAAYNPRTGWGTSDHLPLLITLKRSQE
jgi:endonuclease/exonuclease/phosphatase family metal-dependent hydrolase